MRNSPRLSDSTGYQAQIGPCRSSARDVQERYKRYKSDEEIPFWYLVPGTENCVKKPDGRTASLATK